MAVLALGFFSPGAFAQSAAPIADACAAAGGTGIFHAGGDWYPFPAYEDRAGWDRLTGDMKAALIKQGNKYLEYEWKIAKATDYLDYERTGSRAKMHKVNTPNHNALTALTLAELAEGEGRYLDQIIDGVFLMTERTSWVHSYHQARQKSGRALADGRDLFIDLGAQQWASDLAVVWHFFHGEFDKVDPSISAALQRAMRRQIFDPYLDPAKEKEQSWLGLDRDRKLNNWTAWCNANVILAFLLMDEDEAELHRAVERSIKSMDRFMNSVNSDGGCDEGPGYWNHAAGKLKDYLATLRDASRGKFDLFSHPQVKAMGEYISRVSIGDGWSVNFSDASARATGRPEHVFSFGMDTGSDELMDYALYISVLQNPEEFGRTQMHSGYDINRALYDMKNAPAFRERAGQALAAAGGDKEKMKAQLRKAVPPCTWYPETKHWIARDGKGWVLAAKSGNNAESHNHNDVGSCILFRDDAPILVDAGVETYTSTTFSKDRYSLWTMQSSWHNLPDINGTAQKNGRQYAGTDEVVRLQELSFSADIAGAYPGSALCRHWRRSYSVKDGAVLITDDFELASRKAPDTEHFLVRGAVALPGDMIDGKKLKKGELVITGYTQDRSKVVRIKVSYPKVLTPSVEKKEINDPHIGHVWGPDLKRISFVSSGDAPVKGSYKFIFSVLN